MNSHHQYKIVFFDIDGTLLDKDGRIPDSTRDSIRRLQESGTHVALATGRSPMQLTSIAKELHIDNYICLTGSYAVYQGNVIHNQPLRSDIMDRLITFASQHEDTLLYLGEKEVFVSRADHPDVIEMFKNWLGQEPPEYLPPEEVTFPVYQVILYSPMEHEPMYVEQFPELSVIRWHSYSVDLIPRETSKAEGVKAMLAHLGISPEEAVAFGDAVNDREMLSYVGMGIAMGNAQEELKPYARFITKRADEDGIYHGLKHIGLL